MKVVKEQILAPRPVYPKSIRHHGLLGRAYVKQHMIIDERWTADSLMQEFQKMSLLLRKNVQVQRLEKKVQHKQMLKRYQTLKRQCRDGRSNLKILRSGNPQQMRNILIDHRQMQRLYQKIPLHLAVENINQKTFFKRKERDRLQSLLLKLTQIYEDKLTEKANLENRISYENEFKLDEDIKIVDLKKKLENSKMRLRANMTINSTYKRILKVIQHDATFYYPILHSLEADTEDQSQFIKYILHLGSPALDRFQQLSDQYKIAHNKARRSTRQSLAEISRHRKILVRPSRKEEANKAQHDDVHYRVRNYVRETKSMLSLKAKLEEIEQIIRQIKIATICSNENDICSRIKRRANLADKIGNNISSHTVLETKFKYASDLQGFLNNNFTVNDITRLEKTNTLKDNIKRADEVQENILSHIKSRANLFVLLRLSLWNLHEILRYVGPKRVTRPEYPVHYLKLPLLQYEMLTIKAFPPDAFERNIMKLLADVLSKVEHVTNNFQWKLSASSIDVLQKTFCEQMLDADDVERLSLSGHDLHYKFEVPSETDIMDVKSHKTVPTRSNIKLESARFVEACLKRDE